MIKIYFAPAWGLSNKQMTDWYKTQTPNNAGKWKNLEYTDTKNEADYVIMQETTTENINKSKTIFFGKEPYYIVKNKCTTCYKSFHFEENNAWFPQTWWVNLPYDELKFGEKPVKTKNLSIINSKKKFTEGQNKRFNIINSIIKRDPTLIDVWGGITLGKENKGAFKTKLPPKDKKEGLLPYKYSLGIENGSLPYYFTEKIADPLLCWSMPIYWGCKNIHKFLPEGSYVNIDVDDPHVVDKIIEIIKSDLREQNIDKIKEARELILERYNIWETVYLSIKHNNLLKIFNI